MEEEILFDWNPWWGEKEFSTDSVEREQQDEIQKWMDRPEVIVLTGARRSGKTTLLYMTIEDLLKETDSENILFIKCDDERVDGNIIKEAREKHREIFNPDGRTYLFLDEVQSQEEWDKTVKRIYDLEEDKIILTGSRVLKQELSEALAGRFARFDIYPFSFREFLKAKEADIKDKKTGLQQNKQVKHYLREYLEWGGFPEIVLEKDEELKKQLLKFYSDTILYRDVIEHSNIQKTDKVEKLKSYTLSNFTNLSNYTKIGENLNIDSETVSTYIKAMEDAYFIFPMPIFSYSVKKQQRNPKKLYTIDNGIRNAAGFRFSKDIGRMYENTVFIELKRRGKTPYYWKNQDGKETDFLTHENQEIKQIIQVSYNYPNAEKREIEATKKAIEKHQPQKTLILTHQTRKQIQHKNHQIQVKPLWEWLIEK